VNALRFDFTGARVLVTGGSNGIGLGIARGFADAGARVSITGRRKQARAYDHDLSGFDYHELEVEDGPAIARVAASLGSLDVLVNNAGASFPFEPSEWDPEIFEKSVRVNLFSAFRMSLACKPMLAKSALEGGGSVINVSSMSSFRAVPIVPGYGAAKAGLVQLTKNLAIAWVAEPIRVNSVACGLVESNMTAPMRRMPEIEKAELARCPMGRWGTNADVVPSFLFLASDGARFITGETLCVDGGWLAY
jgi:NAD(P)-dependent dehydrogenase (short-subunit alcohol dehydrogenase family)